MKLNSLVWLTWRQHRWPISGAAVIALLAAYALFVTESDNAAIGSMPIFGFYGLIVQLGFGVVIGMFWGAPLIARELEERTYFVAWGQDVSPVRWLRGKLLVLGVLAVVLGAAVGLGDGYVGDRTSWPTFEAHPLVQAGYAILGLALGVFIGLLSRHVVTAMAATLVFFTLIRILLAAPVRDRYLPPQRVIATWDSTAVVPSGGLELGGGFMGPDSRPVSIPDRCLGLNENTCMRNTKTAIGTYVDFQPVERVGLFRFFEFGLCALLAAALFAVTFWVLRRGGGGWKPSRSHRRITTPAASTPNAESTPKAENAPKAESTQSTESAESTPSVQSTPDTAAAQADG
ncbi:hypothetical protein [Lentzea sp. E54]|uniref:hypothetical protein n=1 Tax=Lentzea xerophila TaxID=3435883 RepID=UPI003DA5038F